MRKVTGANEVFIPCELASNPDTAPSSADESLLTVTPDLLKCAGYQPMQRHCDIYGRNVLLQD